MIYDQFNRPVKSIKKPVQRTLAAAPLLDSWREYVTSGLTPERLASILREADAGDVRRQAELFDQIEEKDAHVLAEKGKRQNVILDVKFNVTPASEDTRDVRVADFVRKYFDNMADYGDVLISMQDGIGKGFSALEVNWDVSEDQALPDKFDFIEQKRFLFTDSSGILRRYPLLISDDDMMGAEIPAWKMLFHRYGGKSGHPARSGIYRVCAWMYLFKNYAIKDWVAFCEVYGMPLRLGKYANGASKNDKDALVAAIQSLGSDAAGIISKDTEIEFIESMKGKATGELFQDLADFANRENSKAIVGQTLSAEAGKVGSYALGKTHEGVRIDLLKADSRSCAGTIRQQIIRPIVGFNFGWDTPLPIYEADWEEPEDLKNLSTVYKNLVEMGQPVATEHVSKRFGVPLPKKGEAVLAASNHTTGGNA
jgi:phage gp29-like protein